jgi:hypothetical protein
MGDLLASSLPNIELPNLELPNFDMITENELLFDKNVLHHRRISRK